MSLRKKATRPKNLVIPHSTHVLGSLAFGRSALPLLQEVPENNVFTFDESSPTIKRRDFCTNDDWTSLQKAVIGVFQKKEQLSPSEMASLHLTVKNIRNSKTGVFAFDYYKQELLKRGMVILREEFRCAIGKKLLQQLENTWDYFFTKILPTLEAILYLVNTKGELSIRQTTLVAFRDIVLLKVNIQEALQSINYKVTPSLRHMFLILQAVNDSYPPNKSKMQLEALVAHIVVPYLGYKGLYEGDNEPVVKSMEPILASRRRSSDANFLRKMSRPFSAHPSQMETLKQLFMSAVRKQEADSSR